MINLDLKDLLKKQIYVIRYGGKEYFKTTNKNTLNRLERALKVLNINNYHVYKIVISKEVIK